MSKTIKEYMNDNRRGDVCSRCGEVVREAKGIACLCWRCVDLLVRIATKGE